MNISRRTAIKGIGAGMATVVATPAVSTAALATGNSSGTDEHSDKLTVKIAHQWGKESIAAVIKNTSDHSTTITSINPVAADYGRFEFSSLTDSGPLTLAAGEEVHVPFTPMGTPGKPYGHFDNRLQKILKESLKISTTGRTARATTSMGPVIV